MKHLIESQLAIKFSLGSSTYDNCPQQRTVPDFKSFAEFILNTTSDAKGKLFICAPFSVGPHDYPETYSGEKSWRLKSHVQLRRFLSLDFDGMTSADWSWLRQWLRDQETNCCWYTTASHTASSPRARLVIELSRLVTRDEGESLGDAYQAHIESCSPAKGSIKFDQSVYRGEQPFFLPVINEKTKQETADDQDSTGGIHDGNALAVDHFLKHVPAEPSTSKLRPANGTWQQKTLAEQAEHIESFKQALRDWAEAGSNYGFDSTTAQEKENTMREVGSVWSWCWRFDQRSLAALIAELTKTPVTELGDNGRIKWLALVTLGARFAPVGSPEAQVIKSAMFDWSEEHPCYEDDYERAVADFEQVWDDGETTTNVTNTPIKTLLSLRKRKQPLPKLIMADNSIEDVLARPFDLADVFGKGNDQTYAQLEPNFGQLFPPLNSDGKAQQLPLFDEPHEQEQVIKERFRFWAASELHTRKPIEWRVKNILPKRGLAAIYGASGSGKTFLVLDLLSRISLGLKFYGHKTTPCPVIYVCLEGLSGVSNRIKAWEQFHHQSLPDTFRIMPDQLSLASQDAQQFALAVSMNKLDGGVIVIDTLNQSAPTADENSSKDMGTIIQNAQTIERLTDSLVILVHHTGKDTSRGLRGHSSLLATLDAAIEIKRGALGREWALTKAKDAENIAGQFFLLESVPLGVDEDGAPISSCVVRPDQSAVFRKPPPKGKNQIIVYDALQQLLVNAGSIPRTELTDQMKPKFGGDPKRQGARVKEAIEGLLGSGHIFETETGDISLEGAIGV